MLGTTNILFAVEALYIRKEAHLRLKNYLLMAMIKFALKCFSGTCGKNLILFAILIIHVDLK